ncbi:MAG: hypothetical protein LBP76_05625 [Treponema sp.]|nr:hypothetical protein [Treponema sp.]
MQWLIGKPQPPGYVGLALLPPEFLEPEGKGNMRRNRYRIAVPTDRRRERYLGHYRLPDSPSRASFAIARASSGENPQVTILVISGNWAIYSFPSFSMVQ